MAVPYTDVAAHPDGGFVRAWSEDRAVVLEIRGARQPPIPIDTDFLRFTRVAVSGKGVIAIAGQGGDGQAWGWRSDDPRGFVAWGLAFGTFPVALKWEGDALHTYRCQPPPPEGAPVIIDGIDSGARMRTVEGIRDPEPSTVDGAWFPVTRCYDTARGSFGGRAFGQYSQRDGVTVGESGGDDIGVLHSGGYFTAHRGPAGRALAFGIHFAVDKFGTLAVAAATEEGAWVKGWPQPWPVDAVVPPQPVSVPAIGRPLRVIWFEHEAPAAGTEHAPPGHGLLRIYAHPLFAKLADFDGTVVAQYVNAATVAEISAQVAALPADLPAFAYWDHRGWPEWPVLRDDDYLAIQAYLGAGESVAALEANLRAWLAAAPLGPQLAVVAQCYQPQGQTIDLPALVPIYARLAIEFPRVTLIAVFSDAGRGGTGLAGHPEARGPWQQLLNGIPSVPNNGGGSVGVKAPFSEAEKAVLDGMAGKFHLLREGTDDDRRVFTYRNAQTLKARFGRGWGTKDAGGGRPQSKDALARFVNEDGSDAAEESGILVSADVINGSSRQMQYPDLEPIPGQHYIHVEPQDWLEDAPQPGAIGVLILDYDTDVHRSDPNGMLVRFEAESDRPIIKITLDLVEDGEPEIPIMFSPEKAQDGRYVRALAFKPTVNGEGFTLRVTAWDDRGRRGSADGATKVRVSV